MCPASEGLYGPNRARNGVGQTSAGLAARAPFILRKLYVVLRNALLFPQKLKQIELKEKSFFHRPSTQKHKGEQNYGNYSQFLERMGSAETHYPG